MPLPLERRPSDHVQSAVSLFDPIMPLRGSQLAARDKMICVNVAVFEKVCPVFGDAYRELRALHFARRSPNESAYFTVPNMTKR
jgi:hypothetical protein